MFAKRIVLAEYFTTEDLTLLFIVRADFDEPRVYEIKQPLDEIRRFVVQNFGAERTPEGAVTVRAGDKIRHLDEAAYQDLFGPFVEPIREWADEGDIVWLVPHDVLHYLPLHALKVEERYLIERNPICYTPSASVMKYCHAKRKGSRKTALVLGDSLGDLPLAREEARLVAGMFQTPPSLAASFGSSPYLGEQAKKSLITSALDDAETREALDILHIACHGQFHPYQPLKSGIQLAPDGQSSSSSTEFPRPWDLTAEEIFGLEMKADLVTLSACESGVNERKPGDELIGLTRALIYAGTPSVVVSLWSVDDVSTAILMERFYQALQEGQNKAQALQSAILRVRDMTAGEVIPYVEKARAGLARGQEVAERTRIRLDEQLATLYKQDWLAQEGQAPTYPFQRLFYWAPFVLVGDWR